MGHIRNYSTTLNFGVVPLVEINRNSVSPQRAPIIISQSARFLFNHFQCKLLHRTCIKMASMYMSVTLVAFPLHFS